MEVIQTLTTLDTIPEDIVNVILRLLMEDDANLYFIPLMLVNKQWKRLLEAIEIDWGVRVSCVANRYQRYVLRNSLPDPKYTGLLRSICYGHSLMTLRRLELDNFMSKNQIIYRSQKTPAIYKGYVGIKKLARLIVHGHPQYYTIIKRYKTIENETKKRVIRLKFLYDVTGDWKRIPILGIKTPRK